MYSGISRTVWQQPTHTERALPSPQSQTGWFPLQEVQQQQSPQKSGWAKDTSSGVDYTTSTSQDQHVYVSSPLYSTVPASTPPYVWTDESHSLPQPAETNQFLPPPTYPRPLILADSELYVRAQKIQLQTDQNPHVQTVLRRSKQIAIGRWNSEEHQYFLKGLEMFQGPAWGEIARLIGTRTSTQVRTHAQKFFTKLARSNQTMPYFEVQIQKERARLVAQGASVTPTAQSAPSASLSATLSPRKHLVSNIARQSHKRSKEETSPPYAAAVQARYPQKAYDIKPRVYTDSAVGYSSVVSPSVAKEWTQQWTSGSARQWPLTSPTSKTTASLQLTQMQMDMGRHENTSTNNAEPDADSLPSMNKLLCRSSAS